MTSQTKGTMIGVGFYVLFIPGMIFLPKDLVMTLFVLFIAWCFGAAMK